MSRCVVIHPNGSTELQDFRPTEHQRLRGLGYKRFALQFLLLGWPAILFLFFFPLPTVPPAVIAIPVLLLSITLILENRRSSPAPAMAQAPE